MAVRSVDAGDYIMALRNGAIVKRYIHYDDKPIAIDPGDWHAAPYGFALLSGLLAAGDEFVCAGSCTDGQSAWAMGSTAEILIRPATVAA